MVSLLSIFTEIESWKIMGTMMITVDGKFYANEPGQQTLILHSKFKIMYVLYPAYICQNDNKKLSQAQNLPHSASIL